MEAPSHSPESEKSPQDLRARRKQATMRDVHEIAVALFERQGVAATTVDEIAAAAGISPRTFFRYFPTKEHAAFGAGGDFRQLAEDTYRQIRDGVSLLDALQAAWSRLFQQIDLRPTQHQEAMRLRQLAEQEPSLIALLVIEDGKLDAEIAAGVAAAAGRAHDDLVLHAAVISINSAARLSYREWTHLREDGHHVSLSEIYARLRAGLTEFLAPE